MIAVLVPQRHTSGIFTDMPTKGFPVIETGLGVSKRGS
jgi:hypothetical protein